MNQIQLSLFLIVNCFFSEFREESFGTLAYFNQHKEIHSELKHKLNKEEQSIAICIVAPEVAMYSISEDFVEYNAMRLLYVQFGASDFSIGCFQMKPSFAETIEKEVRLSKTLMKNHSKLLINNKNKKDCRKKRIDRLLSTRWQSRYLAAFIDIVKMKTINILFNSQEEKIKYWAILYNSGINLSSSEVDKLQSSKLFPRFLGGYNYSEVAFDFYMHMNGIGHN